MSIRQEGVPDEAERQTPHGGSGPQHRSRSWLTMALVACVATLVGATVGAIATEKLESNRTVVMATAAPFTSTGSSAPEHDLSAAIASLQPSVVAISVVSSEETDVGSGVVIRSDGMILTADHVIKHAGSITVTLNDGRKRVAHIVGRARASDLAVLQAETLRDLSPATFGSAKQLAVGSDVLVIGNPLGFAGTVTLGIVSALHRSVPVSGDQPRPIDPLLGFPEHVAPTVFIRDAIQTDAAINPGNSGGPLIDMRGHVIGIVTTIASSDADSDLDTGPGFAIPGDLAWSTANRLMPHG